MLQHELLLLLLQGLGVLDLVLGRDAGGGGALGGNAGGVVELTGEAGGGIGGDADLRRLVAANHCLVSLLLLLSVLLLLLLKSKKHGQLVLIELLLTHLLHLHLLSLICLIGAILAGHMRGIPVGTRSTGAAIVLLLLLGWVIVHK